MVIKNWVKTANGTTITRAFKVTVEDDADVDDLTNAIRVQAIALGFPIVVDRVLNCHGENEEPDKLVNLLNPQKKASSKDDPIIFTEIIDASASAPRTGKKYMVLYYP